MTQRIQWIQDNPYACVLPFNNHGVNLEFDGQRDPQLQRTWLRDSCCCHLDNTRSGFDDVQQSVKLNQPNSRCNKCYGSESTVGTSERTMALMSLNDNEFQQFVESYTADSVNFGIKFSNLCNLSCRSCSPTFSSKYAEVHDIRVPAELSHDLTNDPETWSRITTSITSYLDQQKNVSINLFGGESLIQPGLEKLLNWIEQNNYFERLSLGITTNLTRLDKLPTLLKFKSVHLSASIDSVGENYEYLRPPAHWQRVAENLNQLVPLLQQQKIQFTVQPLFSLNNAFYLIDILNFWQEWTTTNRLFCIKIKNVSMHRPFHLTLQNLPLEYRSSLTEIFARAAQHPMVVDHNQELLEYINGVINFLNSNNTDLDQFDIYLFDTAKHDRATNRWMQQGNQRLYQQLNTSHQTLLAQFQKNLNLEDLEQTQRQQYLFNPL